MKVVVLDDYDYDYIFSFFALQRVDNVVYVFGDVNSKDVERILLYLIFRVEDVLVVKSRFESSIEDKLNKRGPFKGIKSDIIALAEEAKSFDEFLEKLSNKFYIMVLDDISPFEAYDFYKENEQIRSWENARFTRYVEEHLGKLDESYIKEEIEREIEDIEAIIHSMDDDNPSNEIIEVPTYDEYDYGYYGYVEDIEEVADSETKKSVVPVKILVKHHKTGKLFYRTYYVAEDRLEYYRERELTDKEKGIEKPRYITSTSEGDTSF